MVTVDKRFAGIALGVLLSVGAAAHAAGSEQPCCRGQQRGRGMGGAMMDESHAEDMAVFRFLLDHRDALRREVKELPNGIESVTESDDPEIVARLREHVAAMYRRVEEGRPIHARDPLFAEIFRHADAIEMVMEPTEKGIRVVETSSDPYVAKLIKAHAEVVTAFIENGHAEMRKDHALPEKEQPK